VVSPLVLVIGYRCETANRRASFPDAPVECRGSHCFHLAKLIVQLPELAPPQALPTLLLEYR
jgi:hypothetical protein